ncbi:hypothetical protein HYFRA_00010635 [Hymenoscyphus fraxineus]|uniref:LicD/FKTN/FKRP nucleotidyltransferase domain-containing protein n=1 Tax=Hymenoscyphus fraxineus TaxID=746836 RepID=A0A9N9PUD9_9HELO|nr:hypothetical protein HYFRA_00010635 [Hymenoscyphus fraxineus]
MRFLSLIFLAPFLISTLAAPIKTKSGPELEQEAEQETEVDTKYFHEPGGGDEWGHYDIRYFSGAPVSYEVKRHTLHNLIRSYLSIFRSKNIETWIAHGTLLGWWWNGKIMPWDWDLDTQVSASTLTWLGQNMNMTLHNFTISELDGSTGERQYLLDVNPHIDDRLRGDGQNVIDARWIDTVNGLFIDITGLAETNPSMQPGIWSCKNFHRYRTRDLYPLRETEFEGVQALVPYSFDRILTEEYSSRALTKTQHEGHQWFPAQKEWIKQDIFSQESMTNGEAARDAAHIPKSLKGEAVPGFGNLWKAVG